jgi:hypothetical protein
MYSRSAMVVPYGKLDNKCVWFRILIEIRYIQVPVESRYNGTET